MRTINGFPNSKMAMDNFKKWEYLKITCSEKITELSRDLLESIKEMLSQQLKIKIDLQIEKIDCGEYANDPRDLNEFVTTIMEIIREEFKAEYVLDYIFIEGRIEGLLELKENAAKNMTDYILNSKSKEEKMTKPNKTTYEKVAPIEQWIEHGIKKGKGLTITFEVTNEKDAIKSVVELMGRNVVKLKGLEMNTLDLRNLIDIHDKNSAKIRSLEEELYLLKKEVCKTKG